MAEQITLEVPGTTISGLHAGPESGAARATIVPLHGGGYTSAYWDGPVDGRSSLLGQEAQLGFSVLALDRPGYGASRELARDEQDVAQQARLLGELLDGPDESEAPSVGGPDVLAGSAAAFVAAPRVEALIQPAAGHDISVHRVARAYTSASWRSPRTTSCSDR
jgi:pimeloyl-ACP methyl ester carboxylesterase